MFEQFVDYICDPFTYWCPEALYKIEEKDENYNISFSNKKRHSKYPKYFPKCKMAGVKRLKVDIYFRGQRDPNRNEKHELIDKRSKSYKKYTKEDIEDINEYYI